MSYIGKNIRIGVLKMRRQDRADAPLIPGTRREVIKENERGVWVKGWGGTLVFIKNDKFTLIKTLKRTK